ncbi:MAG: hypothetical protein ABI619_12255, partial [Betaproteobacteria bacterium]
MAGTGAARSVLKQRILTAIVLLALLLGCAFLLPGIGWQLLTCLPIALGAEEWSRLAGYRRSLRIVFSAAVLASCLGFVAAFANPRYSADVVQWSTLIFTLALMFWAVAVPLWLYRGWRLSQPLVLG